VMLEWRFYEYMMACCSMLMEASRAAGALVLQLVGLGVKMMY